MATIFPFGAPLAVSPGQQFGAALLVAADGSAETTVTFPSAFVTTIPKVFCQVADVSAVGAYALTWQTDTESLTGFKVYVAGGAPGSTCTVNWYTQGGV